jgi:RNA polymerase sigma factor (sigma-70 family)
MQGQAQAADRSASIFAFEGLAVRLAQAHVRSRLGLDFEDCYQAAMMAVTIAVDRFDPSRSIPLPKFVAICIRYQLGRDLEQAARHRKCLGSDVLEALDPAAPRSGPSCADEFDQLYDAVDQLPADDQALIVKLFGLDGSPPLSRGQVARRAGVCTKTVCRSATRSLSTLRATLTA